MAMTEPTTAGAVLGALGAGGVAGLFAALGLAPAPLFWALVGCTLGLSFAAPAGRLRTAAVYLCAVLACAQLAHVLAARHFDGEAMVANGAALVLGIVFHPLMLAAVNAVPTMARAVVAVAERWIDGRASGGKGGGS